MTSTADISGNSLESNGTVPSPAPIQTGAVNPFVALTPRVRQSIVFVFLLILCAMLVVNLVQGQSSLLLIWLGFTFRSLITLIPVFFYSRNYGVFHPLVFAALWDLATSLMRRSSLYLFGLPYHKALPTYSADQLNALVAYHEVLIGIAHAAIFLGFFYLPTPRVPKFARGAATFPWAKTCIAAGISIAAFMVYASAAGGFTAMVTLRGLDRLDRDVQVSGAHWIVLIGVLSIALMVLIGIRPKLISSPLFWPFMFLAAFLSFASTGSRSAALYPLIAVLMVYFLRSQRVPYLRLAAAGVIVLFGLGALGAFRAAQYGTTGTIRTDVLEDMSFSHGVELGYDDLTSRATDRHGALPVLARVPEDMDLLYGRTYLGMLLIPIPSAILPFEKPMASGRLNGMLNFASTGGVPTGAVVEAYWNFHVAGVVFVFLLWGALVKWMMRLYVNNLFVPGCSALYVFFLLRASPSGSEMTDWLQGSATMIFLMLLYSGGLRIARWTK